MVILLWQIFEHHSSSKTLSEMGDDVDVSGANTFIMVHSEVTSMDTVNKVYAVHSQFLPSWPHPGMIDFTFVHVFLVPEGENILKYQTALSQILMKMAADSQDNGILVFGVLALVCEHLFLESIWYLSGIK